MKFPYSKYAVVPSPAAPERDVLFRPVIPVRFVGPKAVRDVYALLDTGADESYITESMANKLGVIPLSNSTSVVQSASGKMSIDYGHIVVEIADDTEVLSFPLIVGIVSEDWSEAILGHAGFLEHFDATFSYIDRQVALTPRRQ